MQQPILVDNANIRGVYCLVSQDGGCPLRVTHVAAHQCVTLAGNQSPLGNEESRVLHGSAQTARYTLAVVIVICGDDACLRRGIGVIEPCLRQQFAQFLHISLCDSSRTRLNEIHLAGHLRQLLAAELYQHSDAGRHEEGRHLLSWIVEGCEEFVHVLQTVYDDECRPQDDDGVDLRQTADMIQRAIHHESQFVGESLSVDQVLCISHNGAMTDHHTLRLSRRTCGIEDIRRALRSRVGSQSFGNLLISSLRHITLQRCCNAASLVQCEVLHEIVNRRECSQTDNLPRLILSLQRLRPLEHQVVECLIGTHFLPTDNSRLLWIKSGVPFQIVLQGHHDFWLSFCSTILTMLSSVFRFLGVASCASSLIPNSSESIIRIVVTPRESSSLNRKSESKSTSGSASSSIVLIFSFIVCTLFIIIGCKGTNFLPFFALFSLQILLSRIKYVILCPILDDNHSCGVHLS